jgi:hypothetical protein
MATPSVTEAVLEKTPDGLEPAVLLPSQFFAVDAGGASLQPEKRLMLAVLEEAVTTLQRHAFAQTGPGRRIFADVQAWIVSDDEQWPFSFLNACHALGLEPDYLRSGLRRWRDRLRAARTAPPSSPLTLQARCRLTNPSHRAQAFGMSSTGVAGLSTRGDRFER